MSELIAKCLMFCTANETSTILQGRGALESFHGATIDLLLSDVYDHYRTYSMIEKFLQNPPRLSDQLIFQIDAATLKMMIQKYYFSYIQYFMKQRPLTETEHLATKLFVLIP